MGTAPNLITVTFQVKEDTDRDKFIDSVIKLFDGEGTGLETVYVLDNIERVYETSLS